MSTENKAEEVEKNNWPDEVRLEMNQRSEFYSEPRVYQYGYYDGYQKAIKNLPATPSDAPKDEITVKDYEEVLEDHKRLVRELDKIINGENAAKQASLCDIVSQCRNIFRDAPKER